MCRVPVVGGGLRASDAFARTRYTHLRIAECCHEVGAFQTVVEIIAMASFSNDHLPAAFSAVCDDLKAEVCSVAGSPQFVALCSTFSRGLFGLVWRKQRYLTGSQVPDNARLTRLKPPNTSTTSTCRARASESLKAGMPSTEPRAQRPEAAPLGNRS